MLCGYYYTVYLELSPGQQSQLCYNSFWLLSAASSLGTGVKYCSGSRLLESFWNIFELFSGMVVPHPHPTSTIDACEAVVRYGPTPSPGRLTTWICFQGWWYPFTCRLFDHMKQFSGDGTPIGLWTVWRFRRTLASFQNPSCCEEVTTVPGRELVSSWSQFISSNGTTEIWSFFLGPSFQTVSLYVPFSLSSALKMRFPLPLVSPVSGRLLIPSPFLSMPLLSLSVLISLWKQPDLILKMNLAFQAHPVPLWLPIQANRTSRCLIGQAFRTHLSLPSFYWVILFLQFCSWSLSTFLFKAYHLSGVH